jgi:hypothetical protein
MAAGTSSDHLLFPSASNPELHLVHVEDVTWMNLVFLTDLEQLFEPGFNNF